jgi:hypothetical protein
MIYTRRRLPPAATIVLVLRRRPRPRFCEPDQMRLRRKNRVLGRFGKCREEPLSEYEDEDEYEYDKPLRNSSTRQGDPAEICRLITGPHSPGPLQAFSWSTV